MKQIKNFAYIYFELASFHHEQKAFRVEMITFKE